MVLPNKDNASKGEEASELLTNILDTGKIRQVYVNGQTAGRLYRKYQEKALCEAYGNCARAVILPSTSPANAAWTLEKLCDAWSVIRE